MCIGVYRPGMEYLMMWCQQGEPAAAPALDQLLRPQPFRFLANQMGSRADAEAMLHDICLRIHLVRHRIESRETGVEVLPELALQNDGTSHLPPFDELVALVAALPRAQGSGDDVEGGRFNLEEAAHATSSTVGAVNL